MTLLVVDKIIGHRGACAYAPENTLASFEKARTMGCKFIEFDVMCSVDNEPFIFHDDTLKRTSNGRGQVGLVESHYIQSLDAGSWFSRQFKGEPIPHFAAILQWLVAHDMQANIEIKPYPGTDESTTIAVLTYLNRYWPIDKPLPLISSFSWDALSLCRTLSPEIPLGMLLHTWDCNWLEKAHKLGCISIHCNRRILSLERVKEVKDAGFLLFAYTINRRRQAKKLFKWGVDSLFSDYPDLLA